MEATSVALPFLFCTEQSFQRASLSFRQPFFSHAALMHAKPSCLCGVTSRFNARVGSSCGAHSPLKRKSHSSSRVEMARKPGSLQMHPTFEQRWLSCHSFLSFSQVEKRTLNCVSMESAHCVIFSSTIQEHTRFWKKEMCSGFNFFSSMNAAYSLESKKRWHSSTRLHGSVRRSCSSNVTLPSTFVSPNRRTFLPPVLCVESYLHTEPHEG